jgi:cytochrome P450
MSISLLGTKIVILSSYEKGMELFDEKGAIYSDRPYSVMTGELMGFNRNITFLPYGPEWRSTRKWFSQGFGSKSKMVDFHSQLESMTKEFLKKVTHNPDDLNRHITRYVHS